MAAAAVGGMAVAGAVSSLSSVLSSLVDFVKTVVSMVVEGARRIAQWYMNLLSRDPGAAVALALAAIYWVMPE